MRPFVLAPPLALLMALAGCNANRPTPEAVIPIAPSSIRVTPPGAELPHGEGCAAEIARYRAIQSNDLAMGHVAKSVYDEIQGEIAEADRACGRGDNLSAMGLLRASKSKHGYPG